MKKVLFGAIIIAIIGGLGYGVYTVKTKKPEDKMAGMPKDMPPLPVNVFTIKDSIETTTKNYPTLIKPSEEVEVIARAKGILKNKYFKEGSFVSKGALLYTIEQDSYETTLNIAASQNEKAKVNLKKAQKDLERGKALLASKSISDQNYDNLEYAYDSAIVELKSSQSNLKNAQIEYDYTKVYAPISGIAGMKKFDVGEFVGSNETNSNLLTITNTNTVYAEFSLPKEDIATYINQIKSGSIGINLLSGNKVYSNGKINFIAPKIDEATDTILLRATFSNNNNQIIAGEFSKIELTNINLGQVNVIPENAVLKTPKGTFLMVAVDGVVQMRPVELGILVKDGIVITSGLQKGDKVIVSNIAKLRPDAKIMILPDATVPNENNKAKEVK
ncbi:MAG: efflux RND transporter periplasmic adaptor subunit [Arcobacteraceae bacterium]|nr:efflux RND transporter periplasmic adaptor subunit [Arcobacteraceae bacterium]